MLDGRNNASISANVILAGDKKAQKKKAQKKKKTNGNCQWRRNGISVGSEQRSNWNIIALFVRVAAGHSIQRTQKECHGKKNAGKINAKNKEENELKVNKQCYISACFGLRSSTFTVVFHSTSSTRKRWKKKYLSSKQTTQARRNPEKERGKRPQKESKRKERNGKSVKWIPVGYTSAVPTGTQWTENKKERVKILKTNQRLRNKQIGSLCCVFLSGNETKPVHTIVQSTDFPLQELSLQKKSEMAGRREVPG